MYVSGGILQEEVRESVHGKGSSDGSPKSQATRTQLLEQLLNIVCWLVNDAKPWHLYKQKYQEKILSQVVLRLPERLQRVGLQEYIMTKVEAPLDGVSGWT